MSVKLGSVLVVDDYDDARELLTFVLNAAGYETFAARDGAEAVQQARDHHPDAIVMDIFMPNVDGVEATRQLKADDGLRAIPVLACTARADQVQIEEGLFAATVTKPYSPETMLKLLSSVIKPDPH